VTLLFNERNEQIDLENLVPKIKDFSNCVFSQKEIILIFKVSKNSNWTILIFYWNIAVFIVNDLTVQSLFFLHALNRRKKKTIIMHSDSLSKKILANTLAFMSTCNNFSDKCRPTFNTALKDWSQ